LKLALQSLISWSDIMKKLLIAFLAIVLAAPVYAAEGGHGGGFRGGHGGGWGWIAPALVGGVIAYDLAYPYGYPYPYPYPAYAQPYPVYAPPAPAYAPSVAPAPVQYWYFCAAANAYYPYVPTCPSGWQAVPAR
jgi:hypothetical protein